MHTDTDYLDGFQYKNNVLEFFGHAEGFVANNSNILKYVFQYKDQVGNVRVSYAANTITGQAEILEENHYYPYGLKHAGYGLNTTDQNAAYKYRYNSREWQNELDINFTSMDFRLYDNALGRFFGIDALSEQNHYLSTYNFADGNPVIFSDPTGLDAVQDIFDKSGSGETFWENAGNGNFVSNTGQIVSINAGPSSGGGFGGSSSGVSGGSSGVGGFTLINYTAGQAINYLLILPSNYKDDNILRVDFEIAKELGMTIMLVDDIEGFEKGINKLDDDESNIWTIVFNSHGSPGSFSIGETPINMNTEGLGLLKDSLQDKNIIVLACQSGADKRGKDLTQMLSSQWNTDVITSQHKLHPGYLYNGNSIQLMYTPDRENGAQFRRSYQGSIPQTVYNLSMNNKTNNTQYYPSIQQGSWWFD